MTFITIPLLLNAPRYFSPYIYQRKKPKKVATKKVYTPFPPAPVASKVDKQLESGEYFMNEKQRQTKKRIEKRLQSAEVK